MEQLFTMKRELVERELEHYLRDKSPYLSKLYEAARYSVLGAGKRLRPLLSLACCEALGGEERIALPAACAIEMIHAYSLVHDDLPAMDNDDFRRGKPTVHRAFGEGLAILTGDYLLTKAFDVIAASPLLTSQQKVATISVLSQNSGDLGMVGGQVLDIEAEGKEIDLTALQRIHRGKTGALIAAACQCGAVAAAAGEALIELLGSIGTKLGTAFQIVDDILDVTASKKKHGDGLSSDLRNQKTTYVTLLGLDAAQMEAEMLLAESYLQIQQLPGNTALLRQLAESLVIRKS
jgi:geranylgeranyl diphosphate synthase type II